MKALGVTEPDWFFYVENMLLPADRASAETAGAYSVAEVPEEPIRASNNKKGFAKYLSMRDARSTDLYYAHAPTREAKVALAKWVTEHEERERLLLPLKDIVIDLRRLLEGDEAGEEARAATA